MMKSSMNETISFSASSLVMEEEQLANGIAMIIMVTNVTKTLMCIFMFFHSDLSAQRSALAAAGEKKARQQEIAKAKKNASKRAQFQPSAASRVRQPFRTRGSITFGRLHRKPEKILAHNCIFAGTPILQGYSAISLMLLHPFQNRPQAIRDNPYTFHHPGLN